MSGSILKSHCVQYSTGGVRSTFNPNHGYENLNLRLSNQTQVTFSPPILIVKGESKWPSFVPAVILSSGVFWSGLDFRKRRVNLLRGWWAGPFKRRHFGKMPKLKSGQSKTRTGSAWTNAGLDQKTFILHWKRFFSFFFFFLCSLSNFLGSDSKPVFNPII